MGNLKSFLTGFLQQENWSDIGLPLTKKFSRFFVVNRIFMTGRYIIINPDMYDLHMVSK